MCSTWPRSLVKVISAMLTDMTKRILIVDDEPTTISVLSDLLRCAEHGCVYEITSRESLAGALAILSRETFDLIVLDMHMSWIGQPIFQQG